MKAGFNLVLVTALAIASREARAKEPPSVAASVAGCYALKLDPWQPRLDLVRDEELSITPPSHVELRASKSTEGWSKGRYILLPALGKRAFHSGMYWHFKKNREIQLVFTTGHSGLAMALRRSAENLSGTAETFWDSPRAKQTSSVVAIRVPCQDNPPK